MAAKLSHIEVNLGGIVHTLQVDATELQRYDEAGVTYNRVSGPRTGMEDAEPTGAAALATDQSAEIARLKEELAAAKSASPVNKAVNPANK